MLYQAYNYDIHQRHERDEYHGREGVAYHGAGGLEPVQEHCGELRGEEIHHLFALAAEVGEELGAPIEQTHKDRKSHMTGNGEHRARERNGQAEVHDIFYIFERGEAQRDGDGVNYPVKAVVEIRILPCLELHQQELCSLFDDRNDCERKNDFII